MILPLLVMAQRFKITATFAETIGPMIAMRRAVFVVGSF